jgi:hypothetical protein
LFQEINIGFRVQSRASYEEETEENQIVVEGEVEE